MKELFNINNESYFEEDFLDDITEYEDIIPIIKELEHELTSEEITCTEINDCCNVSKNNKYTEIIGYLNSEDEFITKKEMETYNIKRDELSLFVIRIYKCVDCGKWIIDILED
ncbi:MAG: hypothetical protein GX275_07430 [Clostridiales bacterium]|nr:hypothetical protein [Clostridiales bacterium]